MIRSASASDVCYVEEERCWRRHVLTLLPDALILEPLDTLVWSSAENARTLQALALPGLHVMGELVDVTGWLGGYNFQWAWATGHVAAKAIAAG